MFFLCLALRRNLQVSKKFEVIRRKVIFRCLGSDLLQPFDPNCHPQVKQNQLFERS